MTCRAHIDKYLFVEKDEFDLPNKAEEKTPVKEREVVLNYNNYLTRSLMKQNIQEINKILTYVCLFKKKYKPLYYVIGRFYSL